MGVAPSWPLPNLAWGWRFSNWKTLIWRQHWQKVFLSFLPACNSNNLVFTRWQLMQSQAESEESELSLFMGFWLTLLTTLSLVKTSFDQMLVHNYIHIEMVNKTNSSSAILAVSMEFKQKLSFRFLQMQQMGWRVVTCSQVTIVL